MESNQNQNEKAEVMMKKYIWDEESIKILIELYPHCRSDTLAKKLGCSVNTIYNKAFSLGLKKDAEFLQSPESGRLVKGSTRLEGIRYQFQKGHTPANKGKKQSEYMNREQIEKTKSTRFQKGHLPHNTRQDHAMSDRRDKSGRVYRYIRIGLSKWKPYHRYLWEKSNGEIPKGYNVQFKDGNTLNCTIENLYLISRAEQLKKENSLHARYPEEIQKLIQLKGALNRQINKISKSE